MSAHCGFSGAENLFMDIQKNSGFDFEKSYEDDWMPKIDDDD